MARLSLSFRSFAAVLAAMVFLGSHLPALGGDVAPAQPATKPAAALVEAALQAELTGDAAARSEKLAAAKQADPSYGPAHWHSGEVFFDGKWQSVSEVPQLISKDERRQEYRRLRAAASADPVDQIELARWCMHEGLAAEERVHWMKVLQADPYHELARERLGLVEYRGGLYTAEEVARLKEQARQAEKDFERYKPQFVKLCRQAAGSAKTARESALAELRKVNDPSAIEALEYAVRKYAQSPIAKRELNLAVVAALRNMPQHKATCRVCRAAGSSLRGRRRAAASADDRLCAATDGGPVGANRSGHRCESQRRRHRVGGTDSETGRS
jgi:hypothetical protein